MIGGELEAWTRELIETGNMVQDEDDTVSPDEAERRFNRYVELVDMVEGSEGEEAAEGLLRSIQVKHDYGAYQRTLDAILCRFPPAQGVPAIVRELPALIKRQPEWAGDLLLRIAKECGAGSETSAALFNRHLAEAASASRQVIMRFVEREENGGWLEKHVGVLHPADSRD